jgi:hypothetical protein
MPDLVFEIWGEGSKEHGGFMFPVSQQSDEVRLATSPHAVLMHTFMAPSSFAAFRHNNEWFGYKPWTPPAGLVDHHFTEAEVAEQLEYLNRRHGPSWALTLEALKQLLRDDWDPIGLMPHLPADEYDTYAMQVFSKLRAGASAEDIAEYLSGVDMSGEADHERDRRVAAKAAALMSDGQPPNIRYPPFADVRNVRCRGHEANVRKGDRSQ